MNWGELCVFSLHLCIRMVCFYAGALYLIERLRLHTFTGTCTCSAIEKPVCVS